VQMGLCPFPWALIPNFEGDKSACIDCVFDCLTGMNKLNIIPTDFVCDNFGVQLAVLNQDS
jgi:hypothetical protein